MNRLTHSGQVRSVRQTSRGWALYSVDDVERVHKMKTARLRRREIERVTFTAEEAGLVFQKLREGQALDLIMIETRMHPYVVHAILREYEALTKSLILPREIVERINQLPIEGVTLPITKADDIVGALEHACTPAMCRSCQKRHRTSRCEGCVKTDVERAIAKAEELAAEELEKANANGANEEPAPSAA